MPICCHNVTAKYLIISECDIVTLKSQKKLQVGQLCNKESGCHLFGATRFLIYINNV